MKGESQLIENVHKVRDEITERHCKAIARGDVFTRVNHGRVWTKSRVSGGVEDERG